MHRNNLGSADERQQFEQLVLQIEKIQSANKEEEEEEVCFVI
jgi:hypothetical protein